VAAQEEGREDGLGEGGGPKRGEGRAGRHGGKGGPVPAGLGQGGLGRLGRIGEGNRKMCLRILAAVFWNLNPGDFVILVQNISKDFGIQIKV
jgi:hypothetical protein